MGLNELIEFIRKRLALIRRANSALTLSLPLSALLFVIVCLSYGLIPRPFEVPLFGVIALILIWSFRHAMPDLKPPTPKEAAQVLDSATNAKERFLTLATSARNEPGLSYIAAQAKNYISTFSLEASLPFRIKPMAKRFGITALCLVFISCVILLSGTHSPATPRVSITPETLRELARDVEDFSPELASALQEFANIYESDGALSDKTILALEDLMDKVDSIASELSSDTSSQAQQKEFDSPIEPDPGQSSQVDIHDAKLEEQTSQLEHSQRSEDQQEETGDTQEQSPDLAGSKEQSADPSADKDKTDSGEKGPGDQPDVEGQEQQQGKEKQPKPGEAEKDKDETGVGEGEGQGKAGAEKEQHGKTDAGSDDTGAKDGQASHPSDGGSKDAPDGKDESPSGQQDGQPSDTPSDQSGEKDAEQVLDQLNSTLDALKQQIKEQSAEKPSQSQGDQQSPQQQTDPGTESPGEQDQQSGADDSQSGSDENQQPNGQPKGQGDKPSSDDTQASTKGQDSQPQDKKDSPSDNSQASKGTEKHGGKSDSLPEGDGKDSDQQSIEEAQRAKALPQASEDAPKFGPFDGGNDGLLDGSFSTERVAIPTEKEKIIIHSTGAEDPRRFEHTAPAVARTRLGDDEFAKPDALKAQMEQPIPVEYQHLLR